MNMTLNDYVQQVTNYVERGWHVFPVIPDGKAPMVKGGYKQVYGNTFPTESEITDWYNKRANIGLLMKESGLVLVDVDSYKGKADEISLPETDLIAQTPSGGWHYIYEASSEDFLDHQFPQGVDIKYNGYAVVAPSTIEDNSYTWFKYGSPSKLTYSAIKEIFGVDGNPDTIEIVTTTTPSDDALTTLHSVIVNGFEDGQHNLQLKNIARLLYRAMTSDSEKFKREVIAAVVLGLDSIDDTPQGVKQVAATMQSAIDYEKKRQLSSSASNADNSTGFNDPFPIASFGAVLSEYADYKVEYVIDKWIPEKSLLMMVAPPETYKTWLLVDMAVSLALGDKAKPFLNHYATPDDRMPVLFVQQEDYIGLLMQRFRTLTAAKTAGVSWDCKQYNDGLIVIDHPTFAPIFLHKDNQLRFDNPDSILEMSRKVERYGIKQIFIDPFYTLSGDTNNFFSSAAREMLLLKQIRDKYGAGIMLAHHTKKGNGNGREDMWGSQLLNGATEGMIIVKKRPDGIALKRSGKFFDGAYSITAELDIDTDIDSPIYDIRVEETNEWDDANLTEQDAELVYIQGLLEENGGLRQAELSDIMDVSRTKAKRRLDKLVGEGLATKNGDTYYPMGEEGDIL